MGLKDFAADIAAKAMATGGDQLTVWMNDFNKAAATLETLGFTVEKLTIGMGVLPEVHTALSGKIADIEREKVEKLMQEHKDHASTATLLNALLLAKRVSDHVEGKLNGVTLHIKLGIPPSVNVELH